MNIGIDFDGVLTNYVAVALYQMKEKKGISHEDLKSYNLWECDLDITEKEYMNWATSHDSGFWTDLPMLCTQQDVEALNSVSRWHSIYALTDTPCSDAIHQRNLWLFNNGIEDVSVIPTANKYEVCAVLDMDTMLDDNPNQLLKLASRSIPRLYHPIYPYTKGCAGEGVTSITDYLTRIGAYNA